MYTPVSVMWTPSVLEENDSRDQLWAVSEIFLRAGRNRSEDSYLNQPERISCVKTSEDLVLPIVRLGNNTKLTIHSIPPIFSTENCRERICWVKTSEDLVLPIVRLGNNSKLTTIPQFFSTELTSTPQNFFRERISCIKTIIVKILVLPIVQLL